MAAVRCASPAAGRRVGPRRSSHVTRASAGGPSRRSVLAAPPALLAAQLASPLAASAEDFVNPVDLGDGFLRFYGQATSSSSYGGYGGTDNSKDKFKYYYEVPAAWKQATVNKVEKATNGTDTRWVSTASKDDTAYVITFPGYSTLKPDRRAIIDDLALSDYTLQDALQFADEYQTSEREVGGLTFVDYDIETPGEHILGSVVSDGSRLYALLVRAPLASFAKNEAMYRRVNGSLTVLKRDDAQAAFDAEYYQRAT